MDQCRLSVPHNVCFVSPFLYEKFSQTREGRERGVSGGEKEGDSFATTVVSASSAKFKGKNFARTISPCLNRLDRMCSDENR